MSTPMRSAQHTSMAVLLYLGAANLPAQQVVNVQVPVNDECDEAILMCEPLLEFNTVAWGEPPPECLWFTFCASEEFLSIQVFSDVVAATLMSASGCHQLPRCNSTVEPSWELQPQLGGSFLATDNFPAGTYYLNVTPGVSGQGGEVDIAIEGLVLGACCETEIALPCDDCLSSFAPLPGEEYILNAWVSQEGLPLGSTTIEGPEIAVECPLGNVLGTWHPSGPLIDGWQRVEGMFVIPTLDPDEFHLFLGSSSGDAYFDDIRIFPSDGSMKCYVYDPKDLRFVAELDERHFATRYEYDGEGKLVRVKKETERGVMTIQETRNNSAKPTP